MRVKRNEEIEKLGRYEEILHIGYFTVLADVRPRLDDKDIQQMGI
jgi:hypothetical protein